MTGPDSAALHKARVRALIADVLLAVLALALYGLTLNGDVQPADSGEYQLAAVTLDIPHPPGYPLYTLLGWMITRFPLGSPFARLSALSVIAAAITLVLVARAARHLVGGRWPALLGGFAGAAALMTSTTFWAQATTANIRSLTALFAAWMAYGAIRVWRAPDEPGGLRWAALFAAGAGLGVGHHPSLIFVGAVLGLGVLISGLRARWRVGGWLGVIGVAAATQLVWLYLPLRNGFTGRLAHGDLSTLNGFLDHVLARGFEGDMLYFVLREPARLWDRLSATPMLLGFQFSALALGLCLVGTLALLALPARSERGATGFRPRLAALALLAAGLLHLFITLTYRAPQTVEYALPTWVLMCVLLGAGLAHIAQTGRWIGLALGGLALLAAAGQGWLLYPSYAAIANDRATRDDALSVLRYADADDVILAQWHQATPMWALQAIEGRRTDVRVEYVAPAGAQAYADTYIDRAAAAAKTARAYITSYFPEPLAARGLDAFPLTRTPAWRVAESILISSYNFPLVRFGKDNVMISTLLGAPAEGQPGRMVSLDIWWAKRQAQAGDAISIRIMRPDGRLAANADWRVAGDEARTDFSFRRIALGLPLDLPPGRYEVLAGAYRSKDGAITAFPADGRDFVPIGQIQVTAAEQPPMTQHPIGLSGRQARAGYRPASNGVPALIGADYDTGRPGQLRLLTHWLLGAAPVTVTVLMPDGAPAAPGRTLWANPAGDARYGTLAFDVPPSLGLRVRMEGGAEQALPDASAGERYVSFGGLLLLTRAEAWRSGAGIKAELTWLGTQPLGRDYIVSARLTGGGFYTATDAVPALGAVPTLKWLRGTAVVDRHAFDTAPGTLAGSIVVYDSATQQTLPPLDERYDDLVTYTVPDP